MVLRNVFITVNFLVIQVERVSFLQFIIMIGMHALST
jgi:hypothetical protein